MDRRTILLVAAVLVAAMGAGLVFVYVQGAEDRAAAKVSNQMRLVAIKTILPGESASDAADAGKLLSSPVPEGQVLEGSTNDGGDLEDTIALTTIYPGEQLVTQKFGTIAEIEGRPTLPIPDGKSAITLQMTNATRVTSFTQPGSHVAIYYVPPTGPEDPTLPEPSIGDVPMQAACAIESDVLVLGVGSTSVDKQALAQTPAGGGDETVPQEDVVGVVYLTIAVDSQQAARLVPFQLAQESDPQEPILSFALRNDESDVRNTEGCASFVDEFDTRLRLSGQRQNVNG